MKKLRGILIYLVALWRPKLRLERSPERFLLPQIIALLTLFANFAGLVPLKIAAGSTYAAQEVKGHLVVHLAQGDLPLAEFTDQVRALVSRLEENENLARVTIATGPELASTLNILFGDVENESQLYGGIVRLNLVEKTGHKANLENLQFAVSDFQSAHVDDLRLWKEANRRLRTQSLMGGSAALALVIALIIAMLNLTTRLALRIYQPTLKILHQLGASDHFSALLFQALAFQRALAGALLGGGASLGLLWFLNWALLANAHTGAAQIGPGQIALLILVPLFLIALAVFIARQTALRVLKSVY